MPQTLLHNTIFENITGSNGTFSSHFHDTYTIGLTHEGMFKSVHERKASLAYAYSTRIINPSEVHCGDSHAWQYTNFYPSVELLSTLYEQIYGEKKTPLFEHHIIEDPELYRRLLLFFRSVYSNQEALVVETYLIEALCYLIVQYTHSTQPYAFTCKESKRFARVPEYIHAHLDTSISLDELSALVDVSKYHFLRLFKEQTGLTPHQYILIERIDKAKALVLQGEPFSLASAHAGFSDQSHFIRSFRKIYGYSPKTLFQKSNFILYP